MRKVMLVGALLIGLVGAVLSFIAAAVSIDRETEHKRLKEVNDKLYRQHLSLSRPSNTD